MAERELARGALAAAPLFAGVAPAQLERLLERCSRRALAPAAYVFDQGDAPDAAYLVLSGEVWSVSTSREGNVLFHRSVGPGEIFGEVGVLDGGPRTTAATAPAGCELLVLPAQPLLALLERSGVAALALARTLAGRIRSTSQLLEDAVFLSARQRLARKLVDLSRAQGERRASGVALRQVTHETLAQMVGLHRVTVSNQLAHLEREGLLETRRAGLLVLDLDRLEAFSGAGPSARS